MLIRIRNKDRLPRIRTPDPETSAVFQSPPQPLPMNCRRIVLGRLPFSGVVLSSNLFLCVAASAQRAEETLIADPKTLEEEKVELSPFVVEASSDFGYLAQNSLAGSRLNTKLSDLAAPTTVFTKEFIEDVAATSVDELYQYMVNTQVTLYEDASAQVSNDRKNATMRGLPGGNNSVNYFPTDLRLDTYNSERIDFARGANSILFGLGSPGGVVNVSTKRAVLDQVTGAVSLQGRSWQGLRTEIDYNQPLLKDRLALRLAAVRDDRDSWRETEYNDQKRLYATLRWKITPKTYFDVEWEQGDIHKFDSPTFTARDAYTIWANAGRATYTSGAYTAALGIRNGSTVTHIVVDTDTGVATDWRNKAASVVNNVEGRNVYLSDFDLLPQSVTVLGNGFPQDTKYRRGAAFLAHTFGKKLNVELAATKTEVQRSVFTAAQNSNILAVDMNATTPAGLPNPHLGDAYFEGYPTNQAAQQNREGVRATASYEFDFGKWFGRHILAGLVSEDKEHFRKRQDHITLLSNPYNTANPENAANRIFFRTYVDLDGPLPEISWNDWLNIPISNMRESISGRTLNFGWFNFSPAGGVNNRFVLKSRMGVLQSHWLNDRLVTVLGLRRDEQHAWYSRTGVRNPAFGGYLVGDYQVLPGEEDFVSTASNKTLSAVFRATDWLRLTYNRATNAALPSPTAALPNDTGGRAPNPQGFSEDFGFKIDLGKKMYLSASYYHSAAKNDFQSGTGDTGGAEDNFNDIWRSLAAAGVALPNGRTSDQLQTRANGYNMDSESKGYEIELIANPTDNWRIFANFSQMDLKATNLGRDAISYLAKYRDFWLQGNNGRVLIDESGGLAPVANDGDAVVETVAESVQQADTAFQNAYVAAEGNRPLGQIRYQGNLRTNYSFSRGLLRGFSVGGGERIMSGRVVRYTLATKESVVGPWRHLYDLNFAYKGRLKAFGRDNRWSVQLNVNNVLNERSVIPMRISSTGVLLNYAVQTPREYIVTSSVKF